MRIKISIAVFILMLFTSISVSAYDRTTKDRNMVFLLGPNIGMAINEVDVSKGILLGLDTMIYFRKKESSGKLWMGLALDYRRDFGLDRNLLSSYIKLGTSIVGIELGAVQELSNDNHGTGLRFGVTANFIAASIDLGIQYGSGVDSWRPLFVPYIRYDRVFNSTREHVIEWGTLISIPIPRLPDRIFWGF